MLKDITTTDEIYIHWRNPGSESDRVFTVFRNGYYSPDCIANILCFHDLAHKNMISFDNKRNIFVVKLFETECNFVPEDKMYVQFNE